MERSYRTWQGRLPQESRLRKIASVDEANQYLCREYIADIQPAVCGNSSQPGQRVYPHTPAGSGYSRFSTSGG